MFSALDTFISWITTPIRQLFYLIQRLAPGAGLWNRLSLPARWSLVTFLCLVIAIIAAIIREYLNQKGRFDTDVMLYVVLSVLAIAISILVYWFVYYWLKEEPSKYPEIDRVMIDGLDQLSQRGIPILKTPIFLVLGTENVACNRSMLAGANFKVPVNAPSSGEGPISFHASEEGIWIFLNDCSAISRLYSSERETIQAAYTPNENEQDPATGTIGAGDMAIDQDDRDGDWGRPIESDHQESDAVTEGTVQLTDDIDLSQSEAKPTTSPKKKITSLNLSDAEDRIRYVARWLKKVRKNVCPMNGLLTAIPFELIESSPDHLILAVRKDLDTLRQALQVRVANTLLVTGMEREPGFVEMIRRLGPQKALKQRFGKGSDPWISPQKDRLEALSIHSSAVFEDQIFEMFHQEDSLRNRQNAKLFSLLCRVRGKFAASLTKVMGEAFGFDPSKQPDLVNEQFLFAGCYFAGSGNERNNQAFLASVLKKVSELQGELEWLPSARKKDAKLASYANWMALVGLLSLVTIIAIVSWNYFGPPYSEKSE